MSCPNAYLVPLTFSTSGPQHKLLIHQVFTQTYLIMPLRTPTYQQCGSLGVRWLDGGPRPKTGDPVHCDCKPLPVVFLSGLPSCRLRRVRKHQQVSLMFFCPVVCILRSGTLSTFSSMKECDSYSAKLQTVSSWDVNSTQNVTAMCISW